MPDQDLADRRFAEMLFRQADRTIARDKRRAAAAERRRRRKAMRKKRRKHKKWMRHLRRKLAPPHPRRRDRAQLGPKVQVGKWSRVTLSTGKKTVIETYQNDALGRRFLKQEVCFDATHRGPPFASGGPLHLYQIHDTSYQVQGRGYSYRKLSSSTGSEYDGGFIPTGWFGSDAIPTTTELRNIGISGKYDLSYGVPTQVDAAAVYNRARPRIEGVDASVFTGELREMPRALRDSARSFHEKWSFLRGRRDLPYMAPDEVASDFLSYQFGWAPFIKDLLSFYDTYRRSDELLGTTADLNGQWIRRRRRMGTTHERTPNLRFYNPKVYPSVSELLVFRNVDGHSCWGHSDYWKEITTSTWFSGWFRYWLPVFDRGNPRYSSRYFWVMRRVALYGLRVNPSTVWNLTPWSWLIDWGSNAGDVFDNISAHGYDNLASKECYVMRRVTEVWRHKATVFMQPPATDRTCDWALAVTSKFRMKAATPFGFNLTWDALSPRQLAILVSLGITRAKF